MDTGRDSSREAGKESGDSGTVGIPNDTGPDNAPPGGQPVQYHRWYDMDIQLSELVHSLEKLSEESQVLFAHLLTLFSDELVRIRGRSFFSEMEWDTLVGIYKSKGGRRWYDQQPALHKAFNKLYSLNDIDKAAIAKELYVPIRIVKSYEQHCQVLHRAPELERICQIVATCFKDGPENAQEIYRKF